MFKKIFSLMKNSTILNGGKSSSTRIINYGISIIIYLFCVVFIGLEISTAIVSIVNTGKYIISNEIIIIFGSILTHQLALLGINKHHETKQKKENKEVNQ